jgi:hypothetical protein
MVESLAPLDLVNGETWKDEDEKYVITQGSYRLEVFKEPF